MNTMRPKQCSWSCVLYLFIHPSCFDITVSKLLPRQIIHMPGFNGICIWLKAHSYENTIKCTVPKMICYLFFANQYLDNHMIHRRLPLMVFYLLDLLGGYLKWKLWLSKTRSVRVPSIGALSEVMPHSSGSSGSSSSSYSCCSGMESRWWDN